MTAPDETDIRSLIRELIGEVIPEAMGGAEVRRISVGNDAELAAFVESILALSRDQNELARYRSGSLQFSLAATGDGQQVERDLLHHPIASAGPVVPQAPRPVLRIDKGAVTERMLANAMAEGSSVVVGAGAVITPLAREFARKNGMNLRSPS